MATQSPTRPRGAARRTALLDATLALVGELGADAVTHRRVAERAGLPLASTTYWFDSKEALLTEALRHAAALDTARLRAAAGAAGAGAGAGAAGAGEAAGAGAEPPTPAAIVGLLLGPLPAAPGEPGSERATLITTYTLMLEAARRPALQAISADWTAAYLDAIAPLLARAGSARPADDARLLVAAVDGLLIDRLATGAGDAALDPRPELERLLGALLHTP